MNPSSFPMWAVISCLAVSCHSQPEASDSSDASPGSEDISIDRSSQVGDDGSALGMDSATDRGVPPLDQARSGDRDSPERGDLVTADSGGDAGVFEGAIREIVAAPASHLTCAVLMNGEVYCWGYAPPVNDAMPVPDTYRPRRMRGLPGIVTLGISNANACGVDQAGAVWCWGAGNFNGVLASGAMGTVLTPERRMDIDGVARVAWSGSLFFAQRTNGTVFVRDHLHAFGPLTFTLPSPAVDLATELGDQFCVVLRDGHVACSGAYISDVRPWLLAEGPRVVEGLGDVVQIAVGCASYCALKRDGTVWCWGSNGQGQTGTPIGESERCFVARIEGEHPADVYIACVRRPRQVPGLANVVEVRAGCLRACARLQDGTVWCWGENGTPSRLAAGAVGGRIGDGLPNTELCSPEPWVPADQTPPAWPCRQRPSRVAGISTATHLTMGTGRTCAALRSGQIWCWGDGELGDGTPTSRTTPVPVVAPR